jgi:hypothetical protein
VTYLLDKHPVASTWSAFGLVSGGTLAGFCQQLTPVLQVISLGLTITLGAIAVGTQFAAIFRKSPPRKK